MLHAGENSWVPLWHCVGTASFPSMREHLCLCYLRLDLIVSVSHIRSRHSHTFVESCSVGRFFGGCLSIDVRNAFHPKLRSSIAD